MMAAPSMRDWAKPLAKKGMERRRLGWVDVPFVAFLVAWVCLMFALVDEASAECNGWSLEAGIAAHAAGLSAPDYTTPNPLGVIELRRTAGPWVFTLSHTSSLEGFPYVFDSPSEHGFGINQASMRYRFTW